MKRGENLSNTSVGSVQFDFKINPKSIDVEMGKVSSYIGNSFKNMFSGIGRQTSQFAKSSLSGVNNELRNIAQTGSKTSNEVSKSASKMSKEYEKTESQIAKLNKEMSEFFSQQDTIAKGYQGLPAFTGMSEDESMDKMLKSDPAYQKLSAEIDELMDKMDPLIAKKRELGEQIKNVGINADGSGEKMNRLSKNTVKAGESAKKATQNTRTFGDEMKKSGFKALGFASMINKSFMTILKRIFIYNMIMKGIRGIMSHMGAALNTNREFINSLNTIKTNLRVAFQPIHDFILPALNALMRAVATVTTYIASAISALFGTTYEKSYGSAKGLEQAKKGMKGYGGTAKQAAKDAKGALAGFDEINTLSMPDASDSGGGGGGGGDGFEMEMPDTSTIDLSGIERFKDIMKDIFKNWGFEKLFQGFKDGLDLVDFDNIRNSWKSVFEDLKEIAGTALEGLQPIFQAAGGAFGTALKYGIAIRGNIFEAVSLGFAQFTSNMKEPIQEWILETSDKFTEGFKNLETIFEVLGSSWLESITRYKQEIADTVEGILTNTTKTLGLVGTIASDSFKIVSGVFASFAKENKAEIQEFTNNIVGMFVGLGELINKVWAESLELLKEFWDEYGKNIVQGVADFATNIGEWFLHLWNDLVRPVWDTMMTTLSTVWDEGLKDLLKELLTFVGEVGKLILQIWNDIIKPLIDNLSNIFGPAIREVLKSVVKNFGDFLIGIAEVISGVYKALGGLIDFISGVFSGDWEKVWGGIRDIFGGIMDSLVALVKMPLNKIIGAINTFLRGVNKIKVPDWMPGGLAGKGFSMSEIPMLAKGGIIDQPTLAMVGERGKEAVMPLENNTGWITDLASQIASIMGTASSSEGGGGDTTLVVKIGEDTLVEKIISSINRQNRISGETVINV